MLDILIGLGNEEMQERQVPIFTKLIALWKK
jgi:hypothetical protein